MQKNKNRSILVLCPWGLKGGYSGPLILLDRLGNALVRTSSTEIEVLFRDRGIEYIPQWVTASYSMIATDANRMSFKDSILWIIRVRKFLSKNSHKYDAIHLHGTYINNLAPLLYLEDRRKAVLFPVLDNGDLMTSRNKVFRLIKQRLIRHVAAHSMHAFALSEGIARDLQLLGVPPAKVSRIPNIVDTQVFKPTPKPEHQSKTLSIGFVGKLGNTKQPHLILEAMAILDLEGIETKAIMIGPFSDSEYQDNFSGLLERLSLTSRVQLEYFQQEIAPYHKIMDVFVLPSLAEGMPGALVEAMSSGLPSIVTNIGSMGDVVSAAKSGFILEKATPNSLADSLRSLYEDPLSMTIMSRNARHYATEHFSDITVAKLYEDAVFGVTN